MNERRISLHIQTSGLDDMHCADSCPQLETSWIFRGKRCRAFDLTLADDGDSTYRPAACHVAEKRDQERP
jgi:hypothetical protein